MPKPVFREEPVLDIARQTLFLHEVAHPAIEYRVTVGEPAPVLVCDRRQIAQALTNLVKNATEAVEAMRETDSDAGSVEIARAQEAGRLVASVLATGDGLPRHRDRSTAPHFTPPPTDNGP